MSKLEQLRERIAEIDGADENLLEFVTGREGALEELFETGSVTLELDSKKFILVLKAEEILDPPDETNHYRQTEPPLLGPASDNEEMCTEQDDGYYCTRPKGHTGEHIAHGEKMEPLHCWGGKP